MRKSHGRTFHTPMPSYHSLTSIPRTRLRTLATSDPLKSTIQSSRAGFALAPLRVYVCTRLVWSANRLFQVKQRPLLEDRRITGPQRTLPRLRIFGTLKPSRTPSQAHSTPVNRSTWYRRLPLRVRRPLFATRARYDHSRSSTDNFAISKIKRKSGFPRRL
jgi:hypothetical protein